MTRTVDGVRITEHYDQDGRIHRDGLPARIEESADGTTRRYYCHGDRHRGNDQPAVIAELPDGSVRTEYWYDDLRHRENGPAVEITGIPGLIHDEFWVDGERHRDGGQPAVIIIDPKGKPSGIEHYHRGQLHLDNGRPAQVLTTAEDIITSTHYRHGAIHCEHGPAVTVVNGSTNETLEEQFWVQGKRVRPSWLWHARRKLGLNPKLKAPSTNARDDDLTWRPTPRSGNGFII